MSMLIALTNRMSFGAISTGRSRPRNTRRSDTRFARPEALETDVSTRNLDAPPLNLVRKYVPELGDRLAEVLEALEAAKTARARVHAASDVASSGAVREAREADLAAVRAGEKPTAYGELVLSRPQLAGEAFALEAYAVEQVQAWNLDAHEAVTDATRTRLSEAAREAADACLAAAEAALAAAGKVPGADDSRRLRVAMLDLSKMDEAAARWRTFAGLLGWVTWKRPVRRGTAWEPPTAEEFPGPGGIEHFKHPITRARALGDDNLRRQLANFKPPIRATRYTS